MADADVIVVGGGPAGSAAAFVLASAGADVMLIDRGDRPGAKNTSGGRIYHYALEALAPGLSREAPSERLVTREQLAFLDGDRCVMLDYQEPALARGNGVSSVVLRSSFDAWLAQQAEQQGALIVPGIRVDSVIEHAGVVTGVIAGGDELTAGVVIGADGVNSTLGRSAGLCQEWRPEQVGIGAKVVVGLDAHELEHRFGLAPGEGCARLYLGSTAGVSGGAFLYTNKASVSLGVVLQARSVAHGHTPVDEILQQFIRHPAVMSLVGTGEVLEYSAHLVPEGGWNAVPQPLGRPGFLLAGDAAGLVINHGYTIRGMDLAILSGIAAAQAVLDADGELATSYAERLNRLGVVRAMKQSRRIPELMDNARLFQNYPALAADVLSSLYSFTESTASPPWQAVLGRVRSRVRRRDLARDAVQLVRGFRG